MRPEELGMKLIYWEVNGEKLLERGVTPSIVTLAEEVEVFDGPKMLYGRWRNILVTFMGRQYLIREWIPEIGLNWDEVQIYAFK